MKILKLLNNKYLSILLIIFFIAYNVKAEDEPIDIWNIDQNKIDFPAPKKEIEKIIPNENFKIVK